jgi:deoxyribonuclease-1
MLKSNYRLVALCMLAFSSGSGAQSLKITPEELDFGTALKFHTDSLPVFVENTGSRTLSIDDINLFHADFFIRRDTSFVVQPGEKDSFYVYFAPRHNIRYNSELIAICREEGAFRINLSATGQYPGTYYSGTFNKSEQELKDALKATVSAGYVSFGYNLARDWMYSTIDNQKYNGAGAAVNTIECAYTGRKVTGYNTRQEAQTNGNLNTEHTYPQSKFNSAEPAQSDMFHLFIVDGPANSVRSNHPFSTVESPTWQNGGSRYASGVFEPRDAHKGNVARAMFYVVIRYQNYGNFLTGQEPVLRRWASQFPPNTLDSLRNEKIFSLQKNRNPFIDHPEFLERITSISANSVAPARLSYVANIPVEQGEAAPVLLYGASGDTVFYSIAFTSTGNRDVSLSHALASGEENILLSALSDTLLPGESSVLRLKVIKEIATRAGDTLLVSSPAGDIRIPLLIDIQALSVEKAPSSPFCFVYPNPAAGRFYVRMGEESRYELEISSLGGKKVHSTVISNTLNEISVSGLAPGYYFVTLKDGRGGQKVYPLVIR